MVAKQANSGAVVATDSAPRPGDFPLGSPASRAAARLQVGRLRDSRRRVQIITSVLLPGLPGEDPKDPNVPHATEWNDCGDVLMRIVYVPSHLWDKAESLARTL
jgi:hypothetical protein